MSKQWKCTECVKHNTDACFNGGRFDDDTCKYMLIDVDYAYEQGRADAIDEFVKAVEKCVAMQWVDIQDIWEIQEKLKEHKQ